MMKARVRHSRETIEDEKIKYHHKTFMFKDSYSLIPSKLSSFPKMLKLDCGQKELYPYNYYTLERLKTDKGVGLINEAGKNESIPWTKEQYDQFRKNIEAIPG